MSTDNRAIGFFTRMSGAIPGRVFKGFRSVAVERGWSIHVLRPWMRDEWVPDKIKNWSLDGAFMQGDLYLQYGPAVWGDRPIVTFSPPFAPPDAGANVSAIAFDDHAVGVLAANHLLGRGLRSFAAALGPHPPFAQDRYAGFQSALGGMPVQVWDDYFAASRSFPDKADFHGIGHWLRSLPRPTGLFVPCDIWAMIMLEWCQDSGVRTPDHVAVIGVDGDESMCEFATPPLTSIELPWEQLGRSAALRLAQMLENPRAKRRDVLRLAPGKVVARKSTDLLAVDDQEVRAALEMIAAEALTPLRPGDVIDHLGASRNRFREAFRRHVGHTVSDEIRRIRIEEAKRLLAQCDLPVDDIAARCGFATTALFYKAFVKVVGIKPGVFRKSRAVPGLP